VDWSNCISIVVFVNSAPSNYKVVLATFRRSHLNQVKRHNPIAISHLYLYVRLVSHLHSLTHSSSAHILKVVAVARGRRRDMHVQSWFVFSVLVLVLALYWQYIIEVFFVGFSPPSGFPGIKCCVPCDCVFFSDPLYTIVLEMH
jgi:phosphoglycerol transferase MdoB-like AlkP superfamily enzyme